MTAYLRRRGRPSPALVVSCLALFAALGGGAYAATSSRDTTLHWQNAATVNSWTLFTTGYAPAGYVKDSNGVVHLRGSIRGGASGSVAFTLPKADRPSHYLYLPIFTSGGTVGNVFIAPNGQVKPSGADASADSSLDGVSFVAGE